MDKLKPGIYEHYKGKLYEFIGTATHSETLEPLVVYKALYTSKEFGPNAIWARPLKIFCNTVVINGKEVPHFKYIGPVQKNI